MRATFLAMSLLILAGAASARAQSLGEGAPDGQTPVPRIMIYPKTVIRAEMLEWAQTDSIRDATGEIPLAVDDIVGKSARRTLLPGRAVYARDVGPPIIVKAGANIDLEFDAPGVVVTARGVALEDGGVGSRIRFRNAESGLIAAGVISASGRVNVSVQ
jgi:flagellar basal body P-ring formation protein FlgA